MSAPSERTGWVDITVNKKTVLDQAHMISQGAVVHGAIIHGANHTDLTHRYVAG